MREIGVLEARTQFSALLNAVEESGEPVVITRHGRPVARISREGALPSPRRRLSGPELAVLMKDFRDRQKPDPEFDRLSWEEIKKLARE